MRGKDLLEKLELVDIEYIQAASMPYRKKRIPAKIAAAIVIFLGISIIIQMNYKNINISISPNTSDKYSSLTDMLNYLGTNEKHDETKGSIKSVSANINGADEMQLSVMYKDYIYHFNSYIDKYSNGIQIFSLKENKLLKNINTISSQTTVLKEFDIHPYTSGMFISQNELILLRTVGQYDDLKTSVNIYSLDDPENPQIKHQYMQSGQLETAFISDNKLYLFTADGMCACGFSAKSDTDDYKPYLSFDDKDIKWTDDEINILGEPKRVFYNAVSIMDLQKNEISEKRAFYGDIQEIFFDENTISFYIKDSLNDFDKPDIYIFDMSDNFSYTSKININNPGVTNILDIKKSGDNYNIICQHYSGILYYWSSEILALSADIKNNTLNYQTFKLDNSNDVIDDIVWDNGNTIITVGKSSIGSTTAKFVIAKFDNGNVSFKNTSLSVDRVTGIDGHEYFNYPFRSIKSMIPIGNNLYLRYNRKPDGFDIIDFSDEPKYIYKSQGEIASDCRFNYRYTWYENGLLHTVAIIPDNSKGSNGKTLSEVYIYSVDPQSSSPFTLVKKSSPLKRKSNLYGIFHGDLTIFQYNGKQFYINSETDSLEILQ